MMRVMVLSASLLGAYAPCCLRDKSVTHSCFIEPHPFNRCMLPSNKKELVDGCLNLGCKYTQESCETPIGEEKMAFEPAAVVKYCKWSDIGKLGDLNLVSENSTKAPPGSDTGLKNTLSVNNTVSVKQENQENKKMNEHESYTIYHPVGPSDTVESIAVRYGLSPESVKSLNNNNVTLQEGGYLAVAGPKHARQPAASQAVCGLASPCATYTMVVMGPFAIGGGYCKPNPDSCACAGMCAPVVGTTNCACATVVPPGGLPSPKAASMATSGLTQQAVH